MKEIYFLAKPFEGKPFVTFSSVGFFTPTEFANSAFFGNTLVVKESSLPAYQFGVCTSRIVGGVLVPFTAEEMIVFRDEYAVIVSLNNEKAKIFDINKESFTYDDTDFPMDEVSRLFYMAIEKTTPENSRIKTMENLKYDLEAANIPAFMAEFWTKLLLIAKHTI